jgi:hypothetical protein
LDVGAGLNLSLVQRPDKTWEGVVAAPSWAMGRESFQFMAKTETDCFKRPEGLTPLILWDWLRSTKDVRREVIHLPRSVSPSRTWQATEWDVYTGALIRKFEHEHAGGLAAQLKQFTAFVGMYVNSDTLPR